MRHEFRYSWGTWHMEGTGVWDGWSAYGAEDATDHCPSGLLAGVRCWNGALPRGASPLGTADEF